MNAAALNPKVVLFACVHNAGRSPMAAAWFNRLADPAQARAISAGTAPATRVEPEVVSAMNEVGIDISGIEPQRLTAELASGATMLVTMGCGDECPVVPGAVREDWALEDPRGRPLDEVRRIRDEIRKRVEALVLHEGWTRLTPRM
jgi:arsenate reductase